MRVLLLGANGQVGYELWRLLAPLHDLVATTRNGLLGPLRVEAIDLEHSEGVSTLVRDGGFEVVINAAAYTAVDMAESEPERAERINHWALRSIAQACAVSGAKLVHYSTDYVYPGTGETPWREDAEPAPASVYGTSKWRGEQAIRASGCRHLILRCQWLYASRGKNFLRTMLRVGRSGKPLRVVADQWGAPTPAAWVALACTQLMHSAEGVLNLSASGRCTWYDFAKAIFELAGMNPELSPCSTSDYGAAAPRPAFGVMDNQRAHQAGVALAHWQRGLEQVWLELQESASQ